jgi:hypothetical protein
MHTHFLLAATASLLSLCPYTATAQTSKPTQIVKGTISDKAVKTPLIGATIQMLTTAGENTTGAVSDADGHFRIAGVPIGKASLRVTYLGYKPAVLNNVTVNSGKEVDLSIELEEDIIRAKEVVVTAKVEKQKPLNDLAVVSARTFSVEETQRFAAAINDPARMASSYAGVIMGSDGNNTIVIRGNAPNGLLWRMEGVDIPSPNHFSNVGTSGGGISILSAQLLSNSDFMTGAFPSEYGNALSGVFDLKLRKGNQDKREYTFQAGVLGLDAAMEGPMRLGSQKGSFLINYRYSTLSLLSKMGVNIGDASTNFQDLSFNAWMPVGKFGTFTLFGIGGLSDQKQSGTADSLTWKDDLNKKYPSNFIANTGVLGLTHNKAWDHTFLKTVLAASVTRNGYEQTRFQPDYSELKQYDQRYTQVKYTLSSTLNHKFNARHFLRAGAYFTLHNFDFTQNDWNIDKETLEQKVKVKGATGTLNAFAQWQYKASEKLTLNGGLHSFWFLLNNRYSIEPRASVKYAFSDRRALSLGYGLHSELQPLGTYFAQSGTDLSTPNRNLDFTKAHHLVLSFDQSFNSNWRLKTELYYQALYKVPVTQSGPTSFSMLNNYDGFETQILTNKGLGRNYGVELTVEKFLTRGFYFLLSSSLYESKYQGSDGIWRDTRFNCNYANTLTAGKEWAWNKRQKNRSIGLNLKLTNFGGIRETPVDLAASRLKGETVRDDSRAFQVQAPAYFRLDLGFRLKRNYNHLTTTFGIDVQNATNRQNVFGRYYDPNTFEIKTVYQSPLIPVMYYRVEF